MSCSFGRLLGGLKWILIEIAEPVDLPPSAPSARPLSDPSRIGPISPGDQASLCLEPSIDEDSKPWENSSAWKDKNEWVKKHLGKSAHKRLILSHHKNLNKGDYLIDDRTANGAGEFEGEHIQFGSEKFPDWDSVLEYLLG